MGVEENDEEDETANKLAEKADTKRCTGQFAWLTHVGGTIMERKWKETKHWFRMKNDRRPQL